jgi:hypothetical protein
VVTFSLCPASAAPAVLEFFSAMYSPSYVLAVNERLLRWQFGASGNAAGGDGTLDMLLAMVDGEIGGCVGFIPGEFQMNGRLWNGAWAANWMVDQKYRRLGLGPLLIRELAKRFDVTLALGGNRDAHDLLPRMGWLDCGNLPRHIAVVDAAAASALTAAQRLEWPEDATARARTARQTAHVARVQRFDDEVTATWDRSFGDVAASRRSARFLNWRYASHPVFEYRLFESRDGGGQRGFAVYRIEQVRDLPIRIGRIVELVGDAGHLVDLARAIVADGAAQGAVLFDFFCASGRVDGPLAEAGFCSGGPQAQSIPFLFQPIDRSRDGVLFMASVQKTGAASPGEWYVTTADGDQDRPS